MIGYILLAYLIMWFCLVLNTDDTKVKKGKEVPLGNYVDGAMIQLNLTASYKTYQSILFEHGKLNGALRDSGWGCEMNITLAGNDYNFTFFYQGRRTIYDLLRDN